MKVKRKLDPDELVTEISLLQNRINQYAFSIDSGEKPNFVYRYLIDRLTMLKNAYSTYQEEGDFDFFEEKEINVGLDVLSKIFTSKRLELLYILAKEEYPSISELSRTVKRDIKNVYTDLKILEQYNLIKLVKNRNGVQPKINVSELTIKIV